MKHKPTNSFVFRREYHNFLMGLSTNDRFFCIEAICDFAFDCKSLPEHENPEINKQLVKICERIDKDLCQYQARCEDGE